MSKNEPTLTIRGASASRSKSAQEVLDIEQRIIDDRLQARCPTFEARPRRLRVTLFVQSQALKLGASVSLSPFSQCRLGGQ